MNRTVASIGYAAFFLGLAIVAAVLFSACSKTDAQISKSVVLLSSPEGTCTGVHIKVLNKRGYYKYYVLSAAHCAGLAIPSVNVVKSIAMGIEQLDYLILSTDSTGKSEYLKVIDLDNTVDLMILESNKTDGAILADVVEANDKVHTITHGGGLPLYRTDGAIISVDFHPSDSFPGFVKTLTTSFIIPGSSGGPLFNEDNELVGIATNYDQWRFFGYFSTLSQIKAFLKNQ